MKKIILALNLISAIAAFVAAYFWFQSATGQLPPMRSYFDAAPPDDPFTQAVQAGARQSRVGAVLAGIAGVAALAAAIAQHRER